MKIENEKKYKKKMKWNTNISQNMNRKIKCSCLCRTYNNAHKIFICTQFSGNSSNNMQQKEYNLYIYSIFGPSSFHVARCLGSEMALTDTNGDTNRVPTLLCTNINTNTKSCTASLVFSDWALKIDFLIASRTQYDRWKSRKGIFGNLKDHSLFLFVNN